MEEQTTETRELTTEEKLVGFLPSAIKTLSSRQEKLRCMKMLGDARYTQFRQTGDRNYLRLAKNCYLAAQQGFRN